MITAAQIHHYSLPAWDELPAAVTYYHFPHNAKNPI